MGHQEAIIAPSSDSGEVTLAPGQDGTPWAEFRKLAFGFSPTHLDSRVICPGFWVVKGVLLVKGQRARPAPSGREGVTCA